MLKPKLQDPTNKEASVLAQAVELAPLFIVILQALELWFKMMGWIN